MLSIFDDVTMKPDLNCWKYRYETSGFEKQIDQIWHQLLPIRNFEVHLRCEILLLFALLQNKTKFLDSEYYKYQGS